MFCYVDALKRHVRPAGSSPSVLMDALDLSIQHARRRTRPSLRFVPQFICDTFHVMARAFSPETFTNPSGDTIFDSTLPPLARYVRSSTITISMAQDRAQWPPVFDKPWKADSLRDFWGYRWHQLFRRTFVILGGRPLSVEWWCMLLAFGMMAVGVILECAKWVGGLGRAWTMAWLLVWGNVMVDGFGRAGMFASSNVFDTASPAKVIVYHYVTAFDRWLRECAS
ncbi:hypothetical protein BKA82DRAFT_4229397 [Pisolithus tinctorius]|nr:hypothetical protein BKA82DRAFT_4229397 [Pisolithus tinctorius]